MAIHAVVDRVRETLRERTVVTEELLMDARVKQQCIDVGEQRIEEVNTQTFLLLLVEALAELNIAHRDTQNFDLHELLLRRVFLAASQETKPA